MRFSIALQTVALLGVLGVTRTGAFSPSSVGFRRTRPLPVSKGADWDNDDFLSSLSGGTKKEMSEQTPEDKLSGFSKSKPDATEDEESQGGSRFKQLLDATEKVAAHHSTQPILYNPAADLPIPNLSPSIPSPPNMENLSVEEQARLFREMVGKQQPSPAYAPQPPPAPVPVRRDSDRPVGRNRDADTIANAADVYLAQLKRDSTVRTIARYQGDMEKANAVMQDEGVEKLKDLLKENPHLTGDENNSFLDTSTEEMIAVMKMTADTEEQDLATSGVSYKEKLKKKLSKKGGGAAEPQMPQPPAVAMQARPPAVPETPKPVQSAATTPAVVSLDVAAAEPTTVNTATSSTVSSVSTASAPPVLDDSEEERRTIRTLMGLILKHRGGPGFGAGRLKDGEAKRFEETLSEVTAILRSEAQNGDVPLASVSRIASKQAAATVPVPASGISGATPAPADQRIASMIACVEGAVLMYKNSPPELQEGILVTLRSALMSAVNTCNQVIAENELKNTQDYQASGASPTSESKTAPERTQFYEVKPYEIKSIEQDTGDDRGPQPQEVESAYNKAGTDENSRFLQTVHEALAASSGDERFGLARLSQKEAAALADKVQETKSVLMDELESGIPQGDPQAHKGSESEPLNRGREVVSSATSRYQQMLAKAKAEKEAGNA